MVFHRIISGMGSIFDTKQLLPFSLNSFMIQRGGKRNFVLTLPLKVNLELSNVAFSELFYQVTLPYKFYK